MQSRENTFKLTDKSWFQTDHDGSNKLTKIELCICRQWRANNDKVF